MTVPAHTVIYTHGGGRLGNQIIRFAHWIAWAHEQGGDVEVLDLAFWPHAQDFAVWRHHPGCVFPLRHGRADRLARLRAGAPRVLGGWTENNNRFLRAVQAAGAWWPGGQAVSLDITREEHLDLDDPAVAARFRARVVTTCCGWLIASWPRVARHQAAIRALFQPAPEPAQLAGAFLGEIRRQHDVVIGVFIRQSDYREWHDGRFYFETAGYAAWMRQLLDLHPGRRVAFVIASEQRQDPAVFAGLPVYFATGTPNAGGAAIESWVELSLCDVVASPPSTFAATAAFVGDRPLWPLVAADQRLDLAQIIPDALIGAARHPEFSLAVR